MAQTAQIVPMPVLTSRIGLHFSFLSKRELYDYQVPVSVHGSGGKVWSSGGYTKTGSVGRPMLRIALSNTGSETRDIYIRLRTWKDHAAKVVGEDYTHRSNRIEPGTTVHADFVLPNVKVQNQAYLDELQVIDGNNKAVELIRPNVLARDLVWSQYTDAERRKLTNIVRAFKAAAVIVPLLILSSCIGSCAYVMSSCPTYNPYCHGVR